MDDDPFGQELIDKCAASAKENCGNHGFILILVKSKDDPQLLCATNLVPEVSINALLSGAQFLRQLKKDADEVIENLRKLNDVDAARLGDGN